MIEAGKYKARATEWKLGLTSTGKEQIGVLFELTESAQTISWYGFFTEQTADRTLESLEYMGWDGVDISNPVGLDRNEVQLVIEDEVNLEGKSFPRVKWVNRLGAGLAMKEELTGGALQNFKQRMAGAVMARRQNAQGGAAPSRNQSPPANQRRPAPGRTSSMPDDERFGGTPSDDDIPF